LKEVLKSKTAGKAKPKKLPEATEQEENPEPEAA
jgi:hypothetical protein